MRDDSRDPLTSQDSPAFGPGLRTQEVPLKKSLWGCGQGRSPGLLHVENGAEGAGSKCVVDQEDLTVSVLRAGRGSGLLCGEPASHAIGMDGEPTRGGSVRRATGPCHREGGGVPVADACGACDPGFTLEFVTVVSVC
ncbi:unnamed protein product [Rangifer tarandus platyrhynchus]|uniref:Uncharacterized protein n=1 Tax=Rangifer tarandus platyrhynchus TaxID=3082113 RepID=A0AC59ZSH6_RANTA